MLYSVGNRVRIKPPTRWDTVILILSDILTQGRYAGVVDRGRDRLDLRKKYQNQTGTVTKSWPGLFNHGHLYDVEMSDGQVFEGLGESCIYPSPCARVGI